VLETRAKRAIAQAQLIEAQDNQQHARNRLAAMTGTPVDRLGRLVDEFDGAQTQTPSLEEWRALALQNNGLLLSLARELEAAREEIRRVNSGHYPRLDLLASTGRSESDTVTTYRQTSRTTSLGVQLNVPLYAGGAVSSQTRQATARLAQAQAELDAKTSETLVDLHRQFHLQQSSGMRIQALLKAVEAGRVLIDATQKSVRGGERTNLDVLTARERLSASERDLLKARHTYLLAGLRLRSLAGVLVESDLGQVASLFEASS
jgi:protease secretion system outer membrane protein